MTMPGLVTQEEKLLAEMKEIAAKLPKKKWLFNICQGQMAFF